MIFFRKNTLSDEMEISNVVILCFAMMGEQVEQNPVSTIFLPILGVICQNFIQCLIRNFCLAIHQLYISAYEGERSGIARFQ